MDISSRKKKILAAVIEEYIRTAEPVGSKAIAASADLGCSSATIRNELAELVSMGYLEQPHTSAGRVPTPLGYRMYVNELMEHKDLTAEETQAITQSLTGRHQRGELMTDASRLASQLTNYPAVTLTASAGVTIRRFDLIYLDANSFIIVLLLSDDTVKNKLVHLPVSAEQSMIQKLAAVFNAHFTGIREPDITPTLISSVERAAQDNLGITAVMPRLSCAARSTELMSVGVMSGSRMPVKWALKTAASFWIMLCSAETGRCTSLFFTVSSLRSSTMMKLLASR